MYFLSFDCANKSLAIGLYNINTDIFGGKNNDDVLNELIDIKNISIEYLDVIDLIPGKKVVNVDIVERTLCLKNKINLINDMIKSKISNYPLTVIIEYQMNINDKSRTVSNQLLYEYSAQPDKYNIVLIKPVQKNMIYLTKELKYCNIIKNFNNNYKCNKEHSKRNFIYFIEKNNLQSMIKYIKKNNIDDIADTFMQTLAYIFT